MDAFVHKQIEHIKSICILVDAGQNPDALIIARSAYESMVILLWAVHSPPRKNRASQWFLYEIKESYCEWVKGEYEDLGLAPDVEKSITENVRNRSNLLLTEKGMRKLNQGKTLSDMDFIIKKLPQFKHMLEDKLLDGKIEQKAYALYKLLSKWPHGDPQGMGMTFEHDGECFSLNDANCEYFGGCAIHLGVISLGRTAILFNDHFGLDFGERLAELGKQYSEL